MRREEFDRILRRHRVWLESGGHEGSKAVLRQENLSFFDLAGEDLTDINLDMANLTGADLRGADLTFATLNEAWFKCADLRGANLSYCQVGAADFTGANLEGAIFHPGWKIALDVTPDERNSLDERLEVIARAAEDMRRAFIARARDLEKQP